MDRKFTFKDLVLFCMLGVLILIVGLAMVQYDRQWDQMDLANAQIEQLVSAQARMNNQMNDMLARLESGVRVDGGGGATTGRDLPRVAPPDYDLHENINTARAHEDFAEGDWIIDAFSANAGRITALTEKSLYGRYIHYNVLETLIETDAETLEPVPFLAESWKIEDNSEAYLAWEAEARKALAEKADADPTVYAERVKEALEAAGDDAPAEGTPEREKLVEEAREGWIDSQIVSDPERPVGATVTFYIRKGVTFSDGVPLTAHDVAFTWDLLYNEQLDAADRRAFYGDIVGDRTVIDDYTIKFDIKRPHYMGWQFAGGMTIVPKHFYSKYTIQEINDNPGLLLGSGPYRMVDPTAWRPGKLLELVRNERYWGPAPGPDKLIYKEITNDVARQTEFRNGTIDVLACTPTQYEDLLRDPAIRERSQALEYLTVPSGYSFIAWQQKRNGKPTKFADKRVRQAMTFLTPRDRIAEEIFLGYSQTTSGPWTPGSPAADPNIKPRPYDPERGRALLAEAGWKDRDGDGIIENEAGEPFRFKLTYSTGSSDVEQMVFAIKDALGKVGVILEPDPLEFSVMIDRLEQQAFDAITLAWGGGAVEPDIRQAYHSDNTDKGEDNANNYANPELDRYIELARQTIDEDKRMPLWHKCHQILHEDQPYTYLFVRKSLRLIDKRVHGIRKVTAGLNDQPRVGWYVPQSLQKHDR